jgi:uncharacterized protein (DUF1684 family)
MTTTAESESQYLARIEDERKQMDQKMSESGSTPLTSDQLKSFKGLSYFPVDLKYKVNARISKADSEQVSVSLTDGSKQDFVKYGTASFRIDGDDYTFEIFKDRDLPELSDRPGQLFIPFKDGTSGVATSDNGRIISFDEPAGAEVELDFNRAYNTFSVYNNNHTGVMAPQQNNARRDFSVGQRKFEDRL